MLENLQVYINGRWVRPGRARTADADNAATDEIFERQSETKMKQFFYLAALLSLLAIAACGGDSKLPNPTGKATITAINAMPRSPNLAFMIEERSIGAVPYQGNSGAAVYDDFEYTFNFDVFYAGDDETSRLVSKNISFAPDQIYTLVATGTVAKPKTILWEIAQREFSGSDSVFQVRFAHTAASLDSIDVYFSLEDVEPALGEQVATLAFGEISAAMDFESDSYEVTITTSGDPSDVLFQSRPSRIGARTDLIVTPFDGDENNTGPIVVRGLGTLGGVVPFNDADNRPTIQLLHAAMDLHAGVGDGLSDVYKNENLTKLIAAGHGFRDLTEPVEISVGNYPVSYTPAGDTSVVSLEATTVINPGLPYRAIAVGEGGEYSLIRSVPDVRSIDTAAKLVYFQSSNNHGVTDLYVVKAGKTIEDEQPFRLGILSGTPNDVFGLAAGKYDVFVTGFADKEILAGPFRLKVELGDVVDMVVYDTVDPAVLDIEIY